ncbi:MAG: hypothetical protein IH921_12880 [Gemmatimonadetes bacterium]|nr:hypothetical protein [Gemmatimonadota bacterium]
MPSTEAQSAGSRSTEAHHRAYLPALGYARVSTDEQAREGVSLEESRSELSALAVRSTETYPENYSERGYRARLISLHESIVGNAQQAILIAFGAVLLVLLIASVNVANLLRGRGEGRGREVAIWSRMGAGRTQSALQKGY